ncbi:MAG: hypothetical protein E6J90_10750 [Deltaproteobacteria bacterium]|nr:MAG: hypothetical protein E6J90_10750 [Deltaproteobacteria bacterium]
MLLTAWRAMTAQWFGDYEIVKQLRVGGMATLYLARRHGAAGFSRRVALKMIHPHLVTQPGFLEMFVDEARICSQISHPNVVHVEEFGVLDGVHYLAMEYLDGCSVSELLQVFRRDRRMLDPELAARVILQVAGGLHAAHETRGADGQRLELIHRDISPSNVLVSVDGNAKLIDFGIAKARNRVSETQAGITLKGKYRYVAPEQAQHVVVDRRCDLFALGIVFWELLVGRHLFADSHLGLLNRLYRTDVAPPSTVNTAVPEVFDPIVLAMLQHDPDDRPQTAAEVQRRIASAIPGAANREAAELGAFAVEVRDRCTERRARRTSTGSAISDSQSFSPSPSPRPRMTSAYRVEVEATPGSGVQVAPPPVPRPWWRRRGVQLGAGLLGAGVILGLVLGRQSRVADGRARPPRPGGAAGTRSSATDRDGAAHGAGSATSREADRGRAADRDGAAHGAGSATARDAAADRGGTAGSAAGRRRARRGQAQAPTRSTHRRRGGGSPARSGSARGQGQAAVHHAAVRRDGQHQRRVCSSRGRDRQEGTDRTRIR